MNKGQREKTDAFTDAISLECLSQTQKWHTLGLFLSPKTVVVSHYPSTPTGLSENYALKQVRKLRKSHQVEGGWKDIWCGTGG